MHEKLIFFKSLLLSFNKPIPTSFSSVEALLKFLFWYDFDWLVTDLTAWKSYH